jgi:hypothetical protein
LRKNEPPDRGGGASLHGRGVEFRPAGEATADGSNSPANMWGVLIVPDGQHAHVVNSGGDAETRPLNANVNYIIKY